MTTKLKISETVIKRLSEAPEPVTGKLYGTFFRNTLLVIGLQVDADYNKDHPLVLSLPAEVDLCGVFSIGNEPLDTQEVKKYFTDVDITDNPVLIEYCNDAETKIRANFIINELVEPTDFGIVPEKQIHSEFIHIRLRAELPFTSELTAECIKNAFINLRSSITTGKMVFNFVKNNVFLLGTDPDSLINLSGDPTVGDLYNNSDELTEGTGRRNKSHNVESTILNAYMLQRATGDGTQQNNSKSHGPLCIVDKKQCRTINIMIPIDALAMINKHTRFVKLYEILVESVIRNIRLYERALLQNVEKHKENTEEMSALEIFHFNPEGCGHFITKIFARNDDEDSLSEERQSLHEQLLLSLQRPLFRRGNQYSFNVDCVGGALVNPHIGLRATDNGGEIACVKGKYKYYHYCQDRMDDNGWGCAYRSLQTLASWFILQGYSDKKVPTHKDIQKCLVDIGDKPNSFIGSRQWIGSTEVSFVLDTLLGITCKILHVSSGAEMASTGPELLNHFQMHGTPVMIGGGTLAHTILGVDYNQLSGEVKFLVLDPHYTGNEDLHVIQSKGWCGWKNVSFWDKTAYYNMCLPQVPYGV